MKSLLYELKINSKISGLFIITYRFGNFVYYKVKVPLVRQLLMMIYYILDFFIMRLLGNSEIRAKCKIGTGLRIDHPYGIIIHNDATIGKNAIIRHQVTIGWSYSRKNGHGVPVIADNVEIGAGAKIIGNIHLGNNVKVGANAVVVNDVADYETVVGIPAQPLPSKINLD
ncbi:serine O-acetyltransferase [Sporolactobacillus putidus]|uniref:Serine acetyltransferase n=1 Tax=Sporolactobacillus putidus TaxID=492735 RepID=A0A917S1Q1_9BACL|nr:serine acetyltransferase [Sporolactobacillus putidus]GGL50669.1 hypothetical protein GCM10007968_13680 [Sporolactobacillus putidus]